MDKIKIPFFTDLISTGLYLGKMPFMPGTFGSLLAIPLGYVANYLTTLGKAILFFVLFFIGIYVSDKYVKITGIEDPSAVVIDEVVALLLFYMLFPFKPFYIIAGFILFRFFDILKPFPINYFDSMHGGLGIMLDDIMAIIYAIFITLIFTSVTEAFKL